MANKNVEKLFSQLRRKVSRMASVANKRLDRLEKNGLEDTPAYRAWQENGAIRFGVKGKTNYEVQAEFYRLNSFLNARTSIVGGVRDYYKAIAQNIGLSGNFSNFKIEIPRFFAIVDAVEKRLKEMGESAASLDYNAIWNAVNVARSRDQSLLSDLSDIDSKVDAALAEFYRDLPNAINQDVWEDFAKAYTQLFKG